MWLDMNTGHAKVSTMLDHSSASPGLLFKNDGNLKISNSKRRTKKFENKKVFYFKWVVLIQGFGAFVCFASGWDIAVLKSKMTDILKQSEIWNSIALLFFKWFGYDSVCVQDLIMD